ncbi:probable ribonuclease 11 [Octodon degus]|uniref:Probable ribonuclease 11 n=1 Tax=Octodon degus TaxID=10160 RepID=A0A6P3FSY6_OCTDE|nr:probable ribonuclease 11 [Octodon degus]
METFPLLLLGLGLILAEPLESIMETVKEESSEEKKQPETVKSGRGKETDEVLMNLTLFDKNASLSLSKDAMPSSLLTFGLRSSIPKGNSPVSNKECGSNTVAWSKDLEAVGSCKSSDNFIHDPADVIHMVREASSCTCEQHQGMWGCESPGLEESLCQLPTDKQFPRCQRHNITLLEKILTVLAGHSLMSWLVSDSKL